MNHPHSKQKRVVSNFQKVKIVPIKTSSIKIDCQLHNLSDASDLSTNINQINSSSIEQNTTRSIAPTTFPPTPADQQLSIWQRFKKWLKH